MTYLDDEVDRIKDDPTGQYTVEDIAAAESWRLTWENRWTADVRSLAERRKQASKEKQDRLYEQIRETQKAADANRALLNTGDISVAEFLNRSARINMQADEYERRLQGLQRAQSIIEDMSGDPVGFKDSMFERWTALQRNRPRVDDWIADRRIERRNAARNRKKG